ncbi:MAG: hypothetical protein AB7P21_23625 [Lautropia sp.]
MNRFAMTLVPSIALGLFAMQAGHAANFGDNPLDTRFSAKVAKERTRQNTLQQQRARETDRFGTNPSDADNTQCGSQNIGNVNTNGRIGSQPREVFVYAPNSTNVVTRGGCR